jgi:glycogen debranching enzyme
LLPHVVLEPKENYNNDFARNHRVLLKNPISEWSSSVFSAKVNIFKEESFFTPNRDYPVEGFLCDLHGSTWKVLDSFGISLRDENLQEVEISPTKVYYNVLSAKYFYEVKKHGEISLDFSLCNTRLPNVASLRIKISQERIPLRFKYFFYFLLKLRPIKGNYIPCNVFSKHPEGVLCSSSKVEVKVESNQSIYSDISKVRSLVWNYKQGYGFRYKENDRVSFKSEQEEIYIIGPFYTNVSEEPIELKVIAGETKHSKEEVLRELLCLSPINYSHVNEILSSIPFEGINDENIREAMRGRLVALLTFGKRISLNSKKYLVPEAGAWWFREIWLRDLYEGLFWNLNTYLIAGLYNFVASQIDFGFSLMNDHGMLPNFIVFEGERKTLNFESIDATLLFHRLVLKLGQITNDKALLEKAHKAFRKFVDAAREDKIKSVRIDGGLILSPPYYSWIDSRYDIKIGNKTIHNFPSRVSTDMLREFLFKYQDEKDVYELLNSSSFFLPEVQAIFCLISNEYERIVKTTNNNTSKLAEESLERYLEILKNSKTNIPPNIIYVSHKNEHLKDETLSSASFSSVSILKSYLSEDILQKALETAQKELVVYRKLMRLGSEAYPFGLITQKREHALYLGDEQYHGYVVWPRETVYLIDLLEKLNLTKEADKILLNNLDASISERIPFYLSELFEVPKPQEMPENESENPTPIKNPAQYWSMWFDPYLKWLLT